MSTKHGIRNLVRRWAAVAALAVVPLIGHAQTYDWAFERAMRTPVGSATDKFFYGGGTGTAVPGAWAKPVPDGGAGLPARFAGEIRNPAGNKVPMSLAGRIPNLKMAATIAMALSRWSLPLAVGMALMDFGPELGVLVERKATGEDGVDVYRGGYEKSIMTYYVYRDNPPRYMSWKSALGACQYAFPTSAIDNTRNAGECWNGDNYKGSVSRAPSCYRGEGSITQVFVSGTVGGNTCVNPYLEPVPMTELEALIASKSGWPSTSVIADAYMDALEATKEKAKPEALQLEGAAKTAGREITKTSTNPDGSIRTEKTVCEFEHIWNRDELTVSTLEVCKTTVTNDGEIGKTTEEEEQKTPENTSGDPAKEQTCADNPDSLQCAELDTPSEEVPKSSKDVSFTEENMGWGSGSCPASPQWSDVLGNHVVNLGPYCDIVVSVVRPLVLAFAALMALAIAIPGVRLQD